MSGQQQIGSDIFLRNEAASRNKNNKTDSTEMGIGTRIKINKHKRE